jgi:hypothetical protein
MIAFIDDHRGAHGVEPICKVLPIAPSTYHAHVAKRRDPAKLSARGRSSTEPARSWPYRHAVKNTPYADWYARFMRRPSKHRAACAGMAQPCR